MIKVNYGNLLESGANIICQQVNYRKVMGAGLALQIRKKYPGIFKEYCDIIDSISYEDIRDGGVVHFYNAPDRKIIANIFGQNYYGKSPQTDYVSLRNGLTTVSQIARLHGYSVGIPFGIGCGLAGGDWRLVYGIIKQVFDSADDDVTLYKLQ